MTHQLDKAKHVDSPNSGRALVTSLLERGVASEDDKVEVELDVVAFEAS